MSKIIIASGPVIVEDNKVLLNKHGDDSFFKFCGGRVEDCEIGSLLEAAKREAKEEMGFDIELNGDEPYIFYTTKQTDEGEVDVILVHYKAKRIGEVKPAEEIREWQWIPLDELGKHDLAPNILPVLKHFGYI